MLFNATIWRRENTMSDGAPYYYAVEPKKTGTHEVRRHIGDPTGTAKDKKTPPSAVSASAASRRRSRPKQFHHSACTCTSQHSPTPPEPKP